MVRQVKIAELTLRKLADAIYDDERLDVWCQERKLMIIPQGCAMILGAYYLTMASKHGLGTKFEEDLRTEKGLFMITRQIEYTQLGENGDDAKEELCDSAARFVIMCQRGTYVEFLTDDVLYK